MIRYNPRKWAPVLFGFARNPALRSLFFDVIGVGEPARAYEPLAWAADAEEAVGIVLEAVRSGDAVLVKASRAVGLEGIATEIANFARAWSPSWSQACSRWSPPS